MNEVDNLFEMAEETLEEVTEMFDGFKNVTTKMGQMETTLHEIKEQTKL